MTIRRGKGFGDVIAATAIATHLHASGHEVTFQTEALCVPILQNHPHIHRVELPQGKANIDLGDVHADQRIYHIQEAYARIARKVVPLPYPLIDPVVRIAESERINVAALLSNFPKPWIFLCPGSWQAMNRMVRTETWAKVMPRVPGTWVNPTNSPMPGTLSVGNGTFRGLMAAISIADMLVTVDSGPMHVGAALGVPMVVIEQAWPIYLRIAPSAVYELVSADVACTRCREHTCPLPGANLDYPACQTVSPERIVLAIDRLQRSMSA
jgi:ADP-heptose:LPS heptosyltransferase